MKINNRVLWLIALPLLFGSLYAQSNLEKSMKRAGLVAIPNDKSKIQELIDPQGELSDEKIALGKKLFFDTQLSKDNTISCASCHDISKGGADGLSVAVGIGGAKNPHHLNSPTVFNAVLFNRQFWDGRSPDLEDQAKGPMQAPFEMGMTPQLAEERINADESYVKAFKEAYGDDVKITFDQIANAIAAFERTLITPSRFDDFLNGDKDALTEQEKRGAGIFIDQGCTNCHTGIAIGGSMQPFAIAGEFTFKDVGDFKGDKDGLIKVPSLRNVTLNAPYFHNGTVDSLKEAIKEMSRIQLSITEIKESDIEDLIAFFKALEGRKPQDIKQ
jgi:cytochrome c peroxidase